MKETLIQRTILDGLLYRGVMAWRNNVLPVPITRGGRVVGFRRVDPHIVGMPDILGILSPQGRMLGVEVKAEGGKQSAAQQEMQRRIEKSGGLYVLAYSWDDVCKVLDQELCASQNT